MSHPSEIQAEVGSIKFTFASAASAAQFAQALLTSERPNAAPEPPQLQTPAIVQSPKTQPATEHRASRVPGQPRGRAGGDALQRILVEVGSHSNGGVLQNQLTETLFAGNRHQTSNALKRMERLAERYQFQVADIVCGEPEGRSQRLRPGPRLDEFLSLLAGTPEMLPAESQ